MENSRYSLHDDKRFEDELNECYFHPSSKYASEKIKFIARNAMLLLWDMDGISVQGVHFSKSDIRYRMLHEMSCDDTEERENRENDPSRITDRNLHAGTRGRRDMARLLLHGDHDRHAPR